MPDIIKSLRKVPSYAIKKLAGTVVGVSTDRPVISLTFDDGPHPKFTGDLLDILEKYNARATFFMVGTCAQRHRDIVEKVACAQHAIGNHSWDHSSLPLVSRKQRMRQILACEKAIAPYGCRLFRPPYGHQSLASHLDALWLGYEVVTWNVAAEDWLGYDAENLVERVTDRISAGSIVLFHDGLYTVLEERFTDRQPTFEAVDIILSRLSKRFEFITVPQLLKQGRPKRRNWYRTEKADWFNQFKTTVA